MAFGAPRGQRVCLDRRVTQDSPERKASLGIGGILDPPDLRDYRVALGSEDRRATEASAGTGAKTEKTGWTESTENRE